jgi:SlyX protein
MGLLNPPDLTVRASSISAMRIAPLAFSPSILAKGAAAVDERCVGCGDIETVYGVRSRPAGHCFRGSGNAMTEILEPRIVELERRLALHERMAEELSAVVAEQGHTIDALTLRVRKLLERLQTVEAVAWDRSPQDDKPPPHY